MINADKWSILTVLIGKFASWQTPPDDRNIRVFADLNVETLNLLHELDLIDLEDEIQDSTHTIKDVLDFMKLYPTVKAEGYLVHYSRPDYRFALSGLRCKKPCKKVRNHFDKWHDATYYKNSGNLCYAEYD